MGVGIGVIFHFLGGFASARFYLPYQRVRRWSWESYWIVGGLFSWLVVPWCATALTIPHYGDVLKATSWATLTWTYLMGPLWGIGGLTFGLSMRYLGISLGMSVALGFCSAFGALIPPFYRDLAKVDGLTLAGLFGAESGRWVSTPI